MPQPLSPARTSSLSQAMADTADCLARVDALLAHPDFTLRNPNKMRSLVGAFAGNLRRFHAADGAGYRWLADRILEVALSPAPAFSTRSPAGGVVVPGRDVGGLTPVKQAGV